jgi:energy-converting hydrogenase B subunit D
MNALQIVMFLLVGAVGTVTVLTRDPPQQVLVLSLYGMVMTILFVVIQAADVALSELAVGAAATPLMLLVALASIRACRKKE